MEVGKQIRNLGLFLTICYGLLFVQLNRITVFDAEELKDKDGNNRDVERNFDRPRGSISTADGVVIAETVPAAEGSDFDLQRQYPTGDLFGQITGYYSLHTGRDGLESLYNDSLTGDDRPIRFDTIDDLIDDYFVDKDHVGNMTISLRNDIQTAARDALEGRQGSVVVLNPQTGAVLGMYSNPTYDPNPLASQDFTTARDAKEALNAQGNLSPLNARSYQEVFPPGSTFKAVTGSAGVDRGGITPESPVYDSVTAYEPPRGAPVPNFGNPPGRCGGALFEILRRSCNSSFAQMGVDIGAEALTLTAEGFGFNQGVPLDLPEPVTSRFPVVRAEDSGFRAQIAIGQNDVAASPLQMALVAAGIANDGEVMEPNVMAEIRDEEQQVVVDADEKVWLTAISSSTASTMRDAMRTVVEEGTAKKLDDGIEQFDVGGKTGTAQRGEGRPPHAWIIGFAGPEGEAATVAVAVILEGADGVSDDQTGGEVAAPVANAVLRVALEGQSAGN